MDVAAQAKPSGLSTSDTEVFLQDRLALLGKLMCLLSLSIFTVFTIESGLVYSWSFAVGELSQPSRLLHLLFSVFFGGVWALCSGKQRSGRLLLALDAGGVIAAALLIATMASYQDTHRAGALDLVVSLTLAQTMRAVVIPSTGRTTLALGVSASTIGIAVFLLAGWLHPARRSEHGEPLILVVIVASWLGMASVVATLASRVIFGLRRAVRLARRIGQYELHEKLGEGGMGVVYRSTHAMLRRDTALKLLPHAKMPAERLARFEREVRQTARLTHPNTVAVFDFGRTPEGVFYYAMEYLDGLDVSRLVGFAGRLPPARVVHILRQVLMSLTEAHELGLIHRDIKPANVMLTERGGEADVVKVVDFGLVKDLEQVDATHLTAAESITGTPQYLAPEALKEPDTVGPASDLYAVAAVGYFMLTGTHLFPGRTVVEVCSHHLHTAPQPPSERIAAPVPASLERLLLQGLAKAPADRPPSARAFREALDHCSEIDPWTEAQAKEWWKENWPRIRATRKTEPVDIPGETVAIDLEVRS